MSGRPTESPSPPTPLPCTGEGRSPRQTGRDSPSPILMGEGVGVEGLFRILSQDAQDCCPVRRTHFTSLYVQWRLMKKFQTNTMLIDTRIARLPPIWARVSEDIANPLRNPS